ncbi:MAG: amidohydrolase family protein [Chloroflexi bacterium]|nr:amidohydrolase family protein [Chloroflexota bacterium]MDA1239696.1 amidohydrolase family protein [Chloroflexota bacterium]
MPTIIDHATIVSADAGRRVLYDAAIGIEDDRIVALGPSAEVHARLPGAEVVDGRGKAVMPGFANCHTHFTLTLSRGIQEDFSFPSTLKFPRAVASYITDEERTVMAQLGALESIRSGTTAAFEIGGNLEVYAEAMASTGIRIVLGETAADLDQPKAAHDGVFEYDDARGEASLERIEALHTRWHGAADGRLSVAVAAHAPEAVSPGLLRRLRDLQERLGTIATIHLNQSWWEVEAVMRVRGVLPTEYLFQNDYLHDRLVAGHCRCMETREIALLGRSGAYASFNSAIAARRGYSPRVSELAAAGCTIAMGSDNMAEDMVEVMRTGLFMERVRLGDGEQPTPEEVLQWATANGHRALGLTDSGSLEVGKKADLIVIDTQRAHLVPTMRIVSAFVHQGTPADVRSMMVDGAWVMRDGAVLTMDEPAIVAEAERIGRRAWGRLLADYPDVPLPIRLDTTT